MRKRIAQTAIAQISIAQISIAQISIAQIAFAQLAISPLEATQISSIKILARLLTSFCQFESGDQNENHRNMQRINERFDPRARFGAQAQAHSLFYSFKF